ncbi:Panacea domain-containing protein [Saccharicrinis sp. FJH54]|uniref:Panacea domain-containing protein n=1 Tax=Saccharicrinis sp. FJH54 TaxID=3344665 RepID=UPI0035D4A2A4
MRTQNPQIRTIELFIYIADKLKNVETYGATMLNKAFYYIDNYNYLRTGHPITNFTYIKQDHGPTPNPYQFLSLKEKLISEGKIYEESKDHHGYIQRKCLTSLKANTSVFDENEMELIDNLLNELKGYNASELSEITHTHPSWQIAMDKEELPFYSFFVTKVEPGDEDIDWAIQEIELYETV